MLENFNHIVVTGALGLSIDISHVEEKNIEVSKVIEKDNGLRRPSASPLNDK